MSRPPTNPPRALVWSVELREKSAPAGTDNTVNYNTYVLGREGIRLARFHHLPIAQVEGEKAGRQSSVLELDLVQREGRRRYADFNSSTDKVAELVAALIGGVAAKKLGLLASGALFAKEVLQADRGRRGRDRRRATQVPRPQTSRREAALAAPTAQLGKLALTGGKHAAVDRRLCLAVSARAMRSASCC